MQGILPSYLLPHKMVERHFLWASMFLMSAIGVLNVFPELLQQHYFSPKLLAITHVIVLAVLTQVIMGVSAQLIPVFFQVPLFKPAWVNLAQITWVFGVFILVYAFWTFQTGWLMLMGGVLIVISGGLYFTNMLMSIQHSKVKNEGNLFIHTSFYWLLLTLIIGFMLAVQLFNPWLKGNILNWLKVHAHLGLVGWFLQMILGCAIRLIPMFLVTKIGYTPLLKVAYPLFNVALLIAIFSKLSNNSYLFYGSGLLVIVSVILIWIYLLFQYKNRIRPKVDSGMSITFWSLMNLGILVIPLFIYTSVFHKGNENVDIVYVFVFVGGFMLGMLMGLTYKILPFLVWMRIYENTQSSAKRKMPAELFSSRLAWLQGGVFFLAMLITAISILLSSDIGVRIGLSGMFLGSLLYTKLVLNLYQLSLQP